jgi:hypothetical protein
MAHTISNELLELGQLLTNPKIKRTELTGIESRLNIFKEGKIKHRLDMLVLSDLEMKFEHLISQ